MRRGVVSSVIAMLIAATPLLAPVADASTLVRSFTPRFQATAQGAIELIGNTIVTCTDPPIAPLVITCAAAQAGASANNQATVAYNSFTYEVCDAAGLCAAGTVDVTVVALPPTDDLLALMANPAQGEAWRRFVLIPVFLAAVLVMIGLVRRQRPR